MAGGFADGALAQIANAGVRRHALAITAAIVALAALCEAVSLFTPALDVWMLALLLLCASAIAALCAALDQALASVTQIASVLEVCSEGAGAQAAPAAAIDNAVRMRANVEAIASTLDKWKCRPRRHAVTGLPLQDEFLALAGKDIEGRPRGVLLGLVRVANYDAMAAFDPIGAEQVLMLFARRLREALDPSRALAHIDRDCFAIWFRGVAPSEECAAELQALSYVLGQELETANFTVTPDVQIGSALYPVDSTDAENLLSRAFVSLARPQRTSDGGLAFFSPSSPEQTRRRFALEQKLRQAIEQQQLEIHYQPIVDIDEGRVQSAEALLRWRHPTLGAVSPAEFVPILEEAGLIEEIGLWTLNATCRQLRLWRDAGLDLKIALNMSTRQLGNPLLCKMIGRTLVAHRLAPSDLELELTETAAMEDVAHTSALFVQLREQGFGLSIDDFGSGYSSLRYLKNLPFTKLKIDREFVAHVDTNDGSRAICQALIELAKGLGITVMAEGVERYEEVACLRNLGCSTFQGFYFARPMPAKELHTAINTREWRLAPHSPVHRQQAELRRRVSE